MYVLAYSHPMWKSRISTQSNGGRKTEWCLLQDRGGELVSMWGMNQSHPDPPSSSGRLLYLPVNVIAYFSSLTATFYPSQCHLQRPCECFPAAWSPSCVALFAFAQEHPGHSLDNVTVITNISHLLAVYTIHSP